MQDVLKKQTVTCTSKVYSRIYIINKIIQQCWDYGHKLVENTGGLIHFEQH